MRNIILILAVLLFFLAFQGCKKDLDTQAPAIALDNPGDYEAFDVPSEIMVRGTVYDDQQLTNIKIQLLNEQMTPVLPGVQLNPEGNNYTLNHAYPVDDILLESGKYYLQVQASDGVQVTNKFVTLQITAAPKRLKYFVVVTKSGSALNVVKIDSAFNATPLLSVTSDYLGSGVFNDDGLFYLGGSYTGDINVYDMAQWQEQWEVPVTVSPPFAWFTGMMVSDGYLWAGYQTGKYEKYELHGNQQQSISTYNAWAPRKFCLAGPYLIVEEKNTTGPEIRLTIRFEYSGALHGERPITENTMAMMAVDATNVCHITNTLAGQSHLYLFNTDFLDEEEPSSTLGTGKAWCAIPNGDRILIGHDQGVYSFSPASLTTTLWLNGIAARSLFVDETNGWVLTGQGKQLKIYLDLFPSVTAVQTITLSDSIVAIHGVYNKD